MNGAKKATPLLLCLICIEMTDFVFAVDSIPAVLAISQDTFIVYASNVSVFVVLDIARFVCEVVLLCVPLVLVLVFCDLMRIGLLRVGCSNTFYQFRRCVHSSKKAVCRRAMQLCCDMSGQMSFICESSILIFVRFPPPLHPFPRPRVVLI